MSRGAARTPAQRAQEAVDVLERRLARVAERQRDLKEALVVIQAEQKRIEARLEYALAHPDLPEAAGGAVVVGIG